jgi:hypothetical protein
MDGSLKTGQLDGSNDSGYMPGSSGSSSDSSPVIAERHRQPAKTEPTRPARSNSPAPMTSLVTGTSPVYSPFEVRDFPFYEAHAATAIRG